MMKRVPWMTVMSGVVLGWAIWLPVIAHKEPGSLSLGRSQVAEAATYIPEPGEGSGASGTPAVTYAVSTPVPASTPSPSEEAQPWNYRLVTVNGLSLGDDIKTIYEIKGPPLSVEQDEILPNSKVYSFKDCQVGMADGAIHYISVLPSAGRIDIDGQILPLDLGVLKEKLGEPYFVAEDGLVYKVGYNALKIYLDSENGQIQSIHFFPANGQ